MRRLLLCLGLLLPAGTAVAQHNHAGSGMAGKAPEAFTATPAFGPDGTLWLVQTEGNRVVVVRSSDLGRTFTAPVAVTPEPLDLDWGPDARARIAVDPKGVAIVTFAIFQDKNFNGRAFHARSTDNGATFTKPQPLTADTTSQRFETVAIDPAGRVFTAWLDKRNGAAARKAGKPYPGAALAYAWSDDEGARFADTHIAHDNTCECCRLGVAFAGPGRPVVIFRNIFPGLVRDHAVVTFRDPVTSGPLNRVSNDNWKIEACPHHGPALAIAADSSQHAAWFTDGSARKGLFYARADSAGAAFGPPRALGTPDRQPSRPYLLAGGTTVHLVWKEFDGSAGGIKVVVRWQVSTDSGKSWSATATVADTSDASDHPLLVGYNGRAYLSWLTRNEGYRLIALGGAS
ncbi:MAG: sialidase family protein [Reyranella sp.]|nr:sialidase family protein [Reyranella sp.]